MGNGKLSAVHAASTPALLRALVMAQKEGTRTRSVMGSHNRRGFKRAVLNEVAPPPPRPLLCAISGTEEG